MSHSLLCCIHNYLPKFLWGFYITSWQGFIGMLLEAHECLGTFLFQVSRGTNSSLFYIALHLIHSICFLPCWFYKYLLFPEQFYKFTNIIATEGFKMRTVVIPSFLSHLKLVRNNLNTLLLQKKKSEGAPQMRVLSLWDWQTNRRCHMYREQQH